MKRAAFALILGLAFTGVGYIRLGITSRPITVVVVGSRDRQLHGKARRKARRQAA